MKLQAISPRLFTSCGVTYHTGRTRLFTSKNKQYISMAVCAKIHVVYQQKLTKYLDDGFPVMDLLATGTHLVCLSAKFTYLFSGLPDMSYGAIIASQKSR